MMPAAAVLRSFRPAIPLGPLTAIIVYIALPETYLGANGEAVALPEPARAALAMAMWMAAWWLTEALPVAATALLPIVAFPLLGLGSVGAVTAPYAHPLIFLFLGGFLLSIGIERWNLHRWLAERVVGATGGDARRLIGGVMAVTAFASMWLSNTATAIMMLPIARSLAAQANGQAGNATGEPANGDGLRGSGPAASAAFGRCLLLAIAYSASIGGMGTLIGSPPNLFVASFLEERYGWTLDFRTWMLLALPLVVTMLPLTWYLLTRHIVPVRPDAAGAAPAPGPSWQALEPGARRIAVVFVLAVLAWIGRPWLNTLAVGELTPFAALTDTGIAMLAGLSLFALPSGGGAGERLMSWRDAESLPIGTLLLFGGGLTLAATIASTGADRFIGAQLAGLAGLPAPLLFALVVATVVFLTELTSNTATTATLAPVLAAAAPLLMLDAGVLVVAVALAASCAFMMPVATPPNAIVFSTGRVSVRDMARAGFVLNLLAIALVTAAGLAWLPLVMEGP